MNETYISPTSNASQKYYSASDFSFKEKFSSHNLVPDNVSLRVSVMDHN